MTHKFNSLIVACHIAFWNFVPLSAYAAGGVIPLPSDSGPLLPKYAREKASDNFVLPAAPKFIAKDKAANESTIELKKVVFTGYSAYSEATLQAIADDYINRPITITELESLRYKISQLYVNDGYLNSGAIIPAQNFVDGVIKIQIVEGLLSQVNATGTERLDPNYVINRLMLGAKTPLNDKELQDQFQLVLEDPLIKRMTAKLRPGTKPGESVLDVEVIREKETQVFGSYDNYRSPSTGSQQANLSGVFRNITGYGDALSLALTKGSGAVNFSLGFQIPINRYDTIATLQIISSNSSVIEEPLDDLEIDNKFKSYSLGLTHPLWKTLNQKMTLGVSFDVKKNASTLLGRRFSFSEGEEEGRSQVSVLRFSQEFVHKELNQVVSARSTFNFGVNAFDATSHKSSGLEDGLYSGWLGQIQYARKVMENGAQIRTRANVQLVDDGVIPLEKFSIGGRYSVRGYRENELVRDEGFSLSLEFDYPVFTGSDEQTYFHGRLSTILFMDYGGAWNHKDKKNNKYLHSVGIGFDWKPTKNVSAELFIAHDLIRAAKKQEYDLQDSGIHFQVSGQSF
jgi:hemolysin activation/secretion protein